jgi:hypothetical protein
MPQEFTIKLTAAQLETVFGLLVQTPMPYSTSAPLISLFQAQVAEQSNQPPAFPPPTEIAAG